MQLRLRVVTALVLLLTGCGLVGSPDDEVYIVKQHHVRYFVEGTAGSASVVIGTPDGEQRKVVSAPLRDNVKALGLDFTFPAASHAYVYVRNLGVHGLVRCIIKIDGFEVIRRSSADPNGHAKCDSNV